MSSSRYSAAPIDDAWLRRQVKCMHTCPVNTNAAGYISLIAQGRFTEAYETAKQPNPFVNVCAKVCAHPCETSCRRGTIDEPVAICALKRFACDQRGQVRPVSKAKRRKEKVAVIGAGPAGLSCAHDLALKGYQVTVFEATGVPGGQLHLGLPEYRLPRTAVWEDVQRILDLGVEIRYHQAAGRDFNLSDLKSQGYGAVFLAVGACRSRDLNIPGVHLPGVLRGIEFLSAVNQGQPVELGRKVVVVGGGNVAMDVARAALRVPGKREVVISCLEARHEMPAWEYEVHEAVVEGCILNNSVGPVKVIGGNRVSGLEVIRVKSVFDSSGRFNPSFHPGSEFVIDGDTVILAIGQVADLSFLRPEDWVELTPRGTISVNRETCDTTAPGIFAGGDAAFGLGLIIDAVSHGRRAARSIHKYLSGEQEDSELVRVMEPVHWFRCQDDYLRLRRRDMPTLAPERRAGSAEVDLGLAPDEALAEARRCLQCFINPWLDSEKCILCAGCVDVCPENCLRIVPFQEVEGIRGGPKDLGGIAGIMLKDEDLCIRCGLCAGRCPTGAMTMQRFSWKEEKVSGRC